MSDIFLSAQQLHWHTVFFGTTAVGKSSFTVNSETAENGQPLPVYGCCDDHLEANMNDQENPRDKAVREAYWAHSDESEFHNIVDSCREYLDIELTGVQLKAVFMMMPEDIVGSGLQWGFTDSVVRDDIGEFVRDSGDRICEVAAQVRSESD